jgi:hypothetical protein
MSAQRYMTPEQLATRWEDVVVVGTLANWRSRTLKGTPTGPAFQKFGRAVRYRVEDVEAYERANFNGQAANDEQERQQA